MRWSWAPLMMLVACSGAEQQDVLAESSSGAATTSPSSTSTSPTATTPGTTPAPAPSSPFTNCDQEKESNDTKERANTINGAICGTISSDSDVDTLTFKLKGGTKKLSLKFDGKVTLEITVGAQTVTLGNGQNPAIPFNKEQPYVIVVRGIDKGATPTWRVEVVES